MIRVASEFFVNPCDHLLVGFLLPNAVASHYDKVKICGHVVFEDIWVGSDRMLFGLEVGVLLVLQVSKRTRQVQISVDTAICDCTSCLMDAVNFYLAFRLMVE
mgnify:FL=1